MIQVQQKVCVQLLRPVLSSMWMGSSHPAYIVQIVIVHELISLALDILSGNFKYDVALAILNSIQEWIIWLRNHPNSQNMDRREVLLALHLIPQGVS
jgi:hypothetical protein